jgi:hypothetical protein
MSDKIYKIPIEWKAYGYNHIEAGSLEEAMEIAKHESLPIGDYLLDSDKYDWEGIKEQYPDEWKNEKLVNEYKDYVRGFMNDTRPMINCLLPATYDQWRANKLTDTTITTNRVEEIMDDE